MDVKHSCRCCLRCPPDKDLTTPYTHLGKAEIYADMLQQCFDIHLVLGDDVSSGICSACVGRLQDASDFKLQVQCCQEELEALLNEVKPVIKSELAGDGEEDNSVSDVLYEELIETLEIVSEDETGEVLGEDPLIKSETDVPSDGDSSGAVCSDGSPTCAREQLTMACSVVLERLRSDAAVHSRDKIYGCEHCGKEFRKKTIIRKHIMDTHLTIRPQFENSQENFTCDFCSSIFQTKLLVLEHEKNEHGVTNFMRAECLKSHFKSRTVKNIFSSRYCSYTSPDTLRRNKKAHTGEKPFQCTYCDYKCGRKYNLQRHHMTHTGAKLFKCSTCDYGFRRKKYLRDHQKIHNGEKPYKCSHCDYRCSKKSNLRVHEQVHTGEKPHKCSHCDYRCSHISNLRQHERKHTGEKPHKCSHCDYRCTDKSTLRIHERIHTGEKPYKCSHCDYRCSNRSDLRRHERIHTGEKPYKCSHCDYRCSHISNLRQHERKHTGEKPHKCSHCDYRCTDKSTLRIHERIHTGEKPYKCSHCDYRCSQKPHLLVHQKMHTGENRTNVAIVSTGAVADPTYKDTKGYTPERNHRNVAISTSSRVID